MSIRAINAVMDHSEARGSKRVVMFVLADHSDDYGFCYPAYERLAHKCRITPRQVMTHIQSLKDSGEIAVHPRMRKSNVYQILLPGLLATDGEQVHKLKEWGVKVSSPLKVTDANLHPNHKELSSSSKRKALEKEHSSLGSGEETFTEPSPLCGNCQSSLDPDRYCQGCGLVWIAS